MPKRLRPITENMELASKLRQRCLTIRSPWKMIDELSGDHGEERFLIIGLAKGHLILTVVYTERGDNIRIISARRATKAERDDYQSQNAKD